MLTDTKKTGLINYKCNTQYLQGTGTSTPVLSMKEIKNRESLVILLILSLMLVIFLLFKKIRASNWK